MSESTGNSRGQSELRSCAICETKLIGGTAVSLVERDTAPARVLWSCSPCVSYHNLLPLAEQTTPASDGRLQFREQRPAAAG